MAAMKVNLADVPAAIEQVLWRVRQGIRKTLDDKILQTQMPETIDFNFEVMIRKDDLTRVETSEHGPTTSTTVTGAQTSTSTRSGGGSTTDSTETSTTDDSSTTEGIENSGDTGTEHGVDVGEELSIDTGQSSSSTGHTSVDTGGEIETYAYETDV